MHQSEMEEAKVKLEKFIKDHTTIEDEVEQHLRSGEPAAEVNPLVKELEADMIVIGTRGKTGLKHLLLGSVAESILRSADVPVLCVRSG